MKLRERWKNMPGDVRIGFAFALCFIPWLAFYVIVGPSAFVILPSFLVFLALLVIALVLAFKLLFRTGRKKRIVPFLLVSGCLVTLWMTELGGSLMDLHLIGRVYLAGGPDKINDWAQELIRKRQADANGSDSVEREQIPQSIRAYLPGWASVGGTIWSDMVRVRIELGGGFYHYGVVVWPSDKAPLQNWWQRILGWPAEVEIYHE